MSDSIALWHAEHVNFAAVLDLLEAQLDLFHKGEPPDYELMLDIMFYMTHYPDVLHHPKEDLAFARIKEREIGARAIVDELTGQHARLKESGDALVHALDGIVDGTITSREHVEAPGRTYLTDFRSHMLMEETAILPVAAKLLSDGDWAEIDAAIRHIDDPLFGENVEKRYAALRRQITRGAGASKAVSR
jgi:hemerythrin-like domain-containing protein